MRHEEFVRWAGTHTTAFGLGASEYDSILAWFHPFDVLGFTGEDLRSSTEWIIANANPIPKWIREHLPIIRDHCTKLVQARLNQIHAKDFNTPDKGECVKCFDAVWICVPHPEKLRSKSCTNRELYRRRFVQLSQRLQRFGENESGKS
mgnify:CR=1 FL=1